MKTRLNKKNETVIITLNADELWAVRAALMTAWSSYRKEDISHMADDALAIRDKTDEAAVYLFRNWG